MASSLWPLLAAAALLGPLAPGARAEVMVFRCEEELFDPSMQPAGTAEMILTYEGGDAGILKVGASFGEIALPATRVERDSKAAGEVIHAIGIRASGPAEVLMPPKAGIEACVIARAGGETLDEDLAAYHVNSCRLAAPSAMDAVAANVSIDLTLLDGEGAAMIGRTYAEPSALPGGKITLDTWPMPNCALATRE